MLKCSLSLKNFNLCNRDTQLEMTALLQQRSAMDRRRLEEGFLLFAAVDVILKHNLPIERVGFDRNDLAEDVTKHYHGAFVKKWGGKLLTLHYKEILLTILNIKIPH